MVPRFTQIDQPRKDQFSPEPTPIDGFDESLRVSEGKSLCSPRLRFGLRFRHCDSQLISPMFLRLLSDRLRLQNQDGSQNERR